VTTELGVKYLAMHAGFVDESDPAYAAKVHDRIRTLADAAKDNGLTLLLETGQETAPELKAFLEKLDHEAVGVNFLYDKGDPVEAVRILSPWIRHVHVKDATRTKEPGTWGAEVPWGTGEVGVDRFLAVLDEVGFTGAMAIEREAGDNRLGDIKQADPRFKENDMTFGMDSVLYWKLSALMFLEFAVWGAWYPVLAARLLGPLKFSGKQTGWVYAALPLACIFMPLLAGNLADKHINTEFILAAAHLVGVLLLFIAGWRRDFKSLFTVILLYSLCYAATLPLVNSLMFYHLAKNDVDAAQSSFIFMWAPIAWAGSGRLLLDRLALGLQDRRRRSRLSDPGGGSVGRHGGGVRGPHAEHAAGEHRWQSHAGCPWDVA